MDPILASIGAKQEELLAFVREMVNIETPSGDEAGITQFAFLDGHVEAIANSTSSDVLRMYSAIGDGDNPNDPGDGTDTNN